MNNILYLMSSGSEAESYKPLLKHVKKPLDKCKVYLVTTASDPEENKDYLKFYSRALRELGIKKIKNYDLKNKDVVILRNDLKNVDIILMCGGNTFYLLKYIRLSGFDKVLPELLSKGVIYIGSSAGSYVCCPTIEMATWKHQDRNRVGMTDFTGLNIVPFLISAHYTDEYESIISNASKTTKYKIITLSDDQAVLCLNGKYAIVGKGKKLAFNG